MGSDDVANGDVLETTVVTKMHCRVLLVNKAETCNSNGVLLQACGAHDLTIKTRFFVQSEDNFRIYIVSPFVCIQDPSTGTCWITRRADQGDVRVTKVMCGAITIKITVTVIPQLKLQIKPKHRPQEKMPPKLLNVLVERKGTQQITLLQTSTSNCLNFRLVMHG